MSATADNPAPEMQSSKRTASDFLIAKSERDAARNWDVFYKKNETRFFKDRHWTDREFADLKDMSTSSSNVADGNEADGEGIAEDDAMWQQVISQQAASSSSSSSNGLRADPNGKGKQKADPVLLEVGCGVGNMIYPLLEKYLILKGYACDFSKRAVDFVKSHPSYDPNRIHAFVFDLCSKPPDPNILEVLSSPSEDGEAPLTRIGRPTIISMIFVLSAVPPHLQEHVMRSMVACLRQASASPEQGSTTADQTEQSAAGTILFRDYAHGDMAQTRFDEKNAKLPSYHEPTLLSSELPYYRRGNDNTLAYFFRKEELEALAAKVGLQGQVQVIERVAENRKNGKVLKRIFLQARWTVLPSCICLPHS